jgi:phospholipid-binding lipoprotein MlaA
MPLGILLALLVALTGVCRAAAPASAAEAEAADEDPFDESDPAQQGVPPIPDPIAPVNRAFFHFNDKLYFWLLKPVAQGYKAVVPEAGRVGVRNFFSNVTTPIRTVNCLLQADLKGSGTELARFGINTTVGVLGFGDPARNRWGIKKRKEDFGQTLGVYGLGQWCYIHWPVLGPSSPRDTVGTVGDRFLDPVSYLGSAGIAVSAYDRINSTSLRIGEYEDLKEAALDPYIALRDAYNQHRRKAIDVRE